MKGRFQVKILFVLLTLMSICTCEGVDIDSDNFRQLVLDSEESWLIEFYSKQCGSCKQFEPIWHKVVPSFKNLKIGRVSIDNKLGMKLAQDHGVLDEGIPAVRVYYSKNGDYKTIMAGDVFDEAKLKREINSTIKQLQLKELTSTQTLKKHDL